jgi:hypothetical protein
LGEKLITTHCSKKQKHRNRFRRNCQFLFTLTVENFGLILGQPAHLFVEMPQGKGDSKRLYWQTECTKFRKGVVSWDGRNDDGFWDFRVNQNVIETE